MRLVDTHVHLCSSRFNVDRERLLKDVQEKLEFVVEVSYNRKTFTCAKELAEKFSFVYFSVGIHPHDSEEDFDESFLDEARKVINHPKCVAVGEIGLDFYRDLSPRSVQERAFLKQLELALESGKTVILHVRDAYDRIIELLRGFNMSFRGVVHSFSGKMNHAEAFLEMGFDIGISGPITYPKNSKLREVVAGVPLERIQIETDAPFLPPQSHRGKRNDPLKVVYVAEEVARIKSVSIEDASKIFVENARRLFGI
ncbi:MAG: TatD DNase family protein [Thermotogota bacterium]|nr:TatD DNase family protein [Thermotogota bacterium]MDK2864725.1 TatD DNase family protein [Thermotogota bacterium]HCZ06580.1 hypothetical protein [Thermotogota bacterium]